MTNAEVYIEKYKKLEATARKFYDFPEDEPVSHFLRGRSEFRQIYADIKYCSEVRNFLQHKEKVDRSFTIEPSDSMMIFIDNLIKRIQKRTHSIDIAIKFKDIYWRSLTDNIKEAMLVMRSRVYTHVPILNNQQVIGVFDENAVFNYLADSGIIDIDDSLTFCDLRDYLSMEKRDMETFIFKKSSLYVDELRSEFEKAFQKGIRIGVAFLTPSGKASEPLQAMITPWDILGRCEDITIE